MVFRKETKVDTFQRQISALRQQLGAEGEYDEESRSAPPNRVESNHGRSYESLAPVREINRTGAPSAFGAPVADDFGIGDFDPAPYASPALDQQTSVVAHDTSWSGDLQSDGSLHLHGKVEGSITARHDVFVAEEAEVDAAIAAENVSIAGLVRGTIRCRNRFEVLPQGRVHGEVFAPVLIVHEGATINGVFTMTGSAAAEPESPLRRRAARTGA
ncbi:MAG: polymer-forming cytoskeletal protein [Thermomicrobiales bacterium]|nr:polymer-forming cytoskeletal protein [Thermomicrobiales bacterium]